MRHTHAVPCFVRAARRWQLSWQRYGWHMLLRNAEGSFERYGQLQNAATAIVRRWRQRQDLMLCRALARWRSNTSFSVSTHRQHQACHMMRSVALRWSHSSLLWGWRLLQHAGEVRQQLVFARSEALSCVVRRMEHREHKLIARFTMRWRMAVASFGIWHVAKRASVVQSTSQREQALSNIFRIESRLHRARLLHSWANLIRCVEWHRTALERRHGAANCIIQQLVRRETFVLCRAVTRWRTSAATTAKPLHYQMRGCFILVSTLQRWNHATLLWAWRVMRSFSKLDYYDKMKRDKHVVERFVKVLSNFESRQLASCLHFWRMSLSDADMHYTQRAHAIASMNGIVRRWQWSWLRYGWSIWHRHVDTRRMATEWRQFAVNGIAERWNQVAALALCRALARWRANVFMCHTVVQQQRRQF